MLGSDGIVISIHSESTTLVADMSNEGFGKSICFANSVVDSAETGWSEDKGIATCNETYKVKNAPLILKIV